jgi:AcrR family transcriptional regulator
MAEPAVVDAPPPAPGRSRRNRGSEVVRGRLIEGGIAEFAAFGFEGASTRRIAEAADAHQSQIKYHFDTKDELWRRCLEQLLSELDAAIAGQDTSDAADPRSVFEATVRGLVGFASARPELNRIMIHEGTHPSDRLTWLFERQIAPRQALLADLWRELGATGHDTAIDPDLVYHTLIGAASLLYANAPEARLMGIEPNDPDVAQRHAEGLIAMFLPPTP